MIEAGSNLASQHNTSEVNIVVRHMIERTGVQLVLITAALILSLSIITHHVPCAYFSLVEDLGVHMPESPILEGQMRHRISVVGHSRLESIHPVEVIEPGSELGISHSRTSEVVKLSDLVLVGHEMCSGMSGQCCAQTMSGHSESIHILHDILMPILGPVVGNCTQDLLLDIQKRVVKASMHLAH